MKKKNSLLKIIGPYWYFVLLFLLVGFLMLYPLGSGIYLSLWRKNFLYPARDSFVWFENFFRLLFQDDVFWKALKNSLVFTAGSVFFEYLAGLGSGLLLNSKYVPLKNFFRGVVLLPWVVPIAVNSLNWRWMLLPEYGFVNVMLTRIGLGSLARGWLSSLTWAMPTVIFVNVWRSFPFFTITILAGLTLIPKELYEASELDGATRWQEFRFITLPSIKKISMVIIVLHVIWTFANFDVIYLLTAGGPLNRTEVLPTYLYQQAFRFFDMGYASSIGVFVFFFLLVTVGFYFTRFSSFSSQ